MSYARYVVTLTVFADSKKSLKFNQLHTEIKS